MSGLQEAMKDGKQAKDLPDSRKNGLLDEAMDRLRSLGKGLEKSKDQISTVTDSLMTTTELQVANAAGNFAEGLYGRDKLQLGPVDGRTAAGLALSAKGLYDVVRGKATGTHYLAVGNGLMAAGVGSSAREAGLALREKWDKGKKEEQPAPQPQVQQPPAPPAAPPVHEGDLDRLVEGLSRQIAARAIHHRDDPPPRGPRARPGPDRRPPVNRVPVRVR